MIFKHKSKLHNQDYHLSLNTSADLELLLLMLFLDHSKLVTDGGPILALMVLQNLLHLEEALAAVLVLAPLLVLFGARGHDLGGPARELRHWNLL